MDIELFKAELEKEIEIYAQEINCLCKAVFIDEEKAYLIICVDDENLYVAEGYYEVVLKSGVSEKECAILAMREFAKRVLFSIIESKTRGQ